MANLERREHECPHSSPALHAALKDVLTYLTGTPEFQQLSAGQNICQSGLSEPAATLVAAAMPPPWLLIFPEARSAKQAVMDLVAYGVDTAYFPAIEVSAYHGISPEPDLVQQRQEVLSGLGQGLINRVVTTNTALAGRVPAPLAWKEATLRLQAGDTLPPTSLAQELIKIGLRPASTVTERGEFSRRGGILDFWPLQSARPLRAEWFGDRIESLRTFDALTQRSQEMIVAAEAWPAREIILPAASWHEASLRVRTAAAEQVSQLRGWGHRAQADRLAALVEDQLGRLGQFQTFEGCEVYAPFFHELALLLEYLPPATRILRFDPAGSAGRLADYLLIQSSERDRRIAAGILLAAPVSLLATASELATAIAAHQVIELLPGEPTTAEDFWWAPPAAAFPNQFIELAKQLATRSRSGQRIVIASSQPQRVFALLDEYGCHATFGAKLPPPKDKLRHAYGGVWIFRESLAAGFEWPALGLAVYSDYEIFGWQKKTIRSKKAAFAGTPITSIEDLRSGDYVVHAKHGIGRYQGLCRLCMDNQEKEYLLVHYQGEDRLYVPVDQVGLLHRYRSGGEASQPKLSKMGGAEWENVKKRVRKSIQTLAEDLIALYAKRAALPGYTFSPDTSWQRELEDAFPYQETVDQLRAIEETKADMELPRPMDRLICGDVGFGKTEVAIRAVFKAVVSGKQAAVLAPTTLLAQQHYQVFRERFSPYPIKIALLSRFRTPSQQKETLRQLALGEVDLVVGTHRLLSKDIHFKDLGLLVVDEEHRFGVNHKERLKVLKVQVDVLSMSATPIPRTLYLALSGARDMSLITTPPANRHPVKTFVGSWDPEVARPAILRELERGGQIFFLHNRVEDLARWGVTVQEIAPQSRVAMAHGQMPESELEEIMLAFVAREYDILVTTTIIESGLDIPSANTIIIHDADKLGLAQLYQLRGRVGRSELKAYCYCFYAHGKELTAEARDRLSAIQQHTALGSGYQIALRDMEIRGVGNILGPEQHGQLLSVGYDTYMQLLEEAIAAGLGQEVAPREAAAIDLPVAAFLPDDWFETPGDKMVQYRRLAQVASLHELELLTAEWRDRFGLPAVPARNLLRLVALKLKATDLHIAAIKTDQGKVRVILQLARALWADLQLSTPALAHWQWSESELVLSRRRLAVEEQLSSLEKLVDALGNLSKLLV
ncbi:MAG: transcription-repair coupling factor [Cyanobacteria bacterium NC_groundwater_1444_Ag_S-0.65um_54_12]|nr:transcription-repair coupling factor [Cyanobacteria bacterium NC_groundwater_1444_Ag_S-0.65um_54_12]